MRYVVSLLFALPFAVLTSHADAKELEWGKEEQAEVESRVMWSRTLSGWVRGVSVGPDNLVVADVAGGTRYLIQGGTGEIVWEGLTNTTVPITGIPHPVIVESEGERYTVRAVASVTRTIWKKTLSGTFLLGDAGSAPGRLLVLSVDQIGTEKAEFRLRALSLTSGDVLWTTTLAGVHIDEATTTVRAVGFGPSVAGQTLLLLVNDDVLGLSRTTGEVVWRHRIQYDRGIAEDVPSWRVVGEDAVLVSRCKIIRMSSKKGAIWSESLGPDCFETRQVGLDESIVAVTFRREDEDADDALVALDAASGEEIWRRALGKHVKGLSAPDGVFLSPHAVFAVDASKKRRLHSFSRSTGELLFSAKVGTGYQIWRNGDNVIVRKSPQDFTAHSVSDGRELWHRRYLTPAMSAAAGAAFAGSMQTSMFMSYGWSYSAARSLADFPLALRGLTVGIQTMAVAPLGDHAYLLTQEGNKKPVIVDLDLRTGSERTHRILRGPGRGCLAFTTANEAEGYVLEVFGGSLACQGSPHIHAIRIPAK